MNELLKKFRKCFGIVLVCCAVLLCGCDGEESLPSDILVSDGESEAAFPLFPIEVCGVTLEKAAERAVSLSPAVTEIICELGFRDRLVGIGSYCDYPEDLNIKRVGSTENPDIDGIVTLKPDVVFTLTPLSERETYILGQSGIAVLTAGVPSDIEGYSAMYADIAAAFYGKELAEDGETRRSAEIGAGAAKALEKAAENAAVGSFVYVTGKRTVAGYDTFESAALGLAGENVCKRMGYVTLEDYYLELRELSPAVMIADSSLTEEDIRESATLSKLLDGGTELRFVNSQYFERPTARTANVFLQLTAGGSGAAPR